MVYAFTCSGVLPVWYKNMTSFAKLGPLESIIGKHYISMVLAHYKSLVLLPLLQAAISLPDSWIHGMCQCSC